MRIPLSILTLLLSLLLLNGACGSGSADAATPASGMGIVVLAEDPELHGIAPEELEARGIRTYFHDFGTAPVGEIVQHVFRLENTDSEPVTITRMQPECSCTKPSIFYETAEGEVVRGSSDRSADIITLPPGTIAEVEFRIDTNKTQAFTHNTDKLYTVMIATDSPNRAYMRLETHLLIENAFQATPMPIQLGRVARNGGGTGKTQIIPAGRVGAKIIGVGDLPGGLLASVTTEPLVGTMGWVCEVTLQPPLDPGPVIHRFDLITEDEEGLPYYPLQVEVHAYVVEDIDWSPMRFVARNAAVVDGPLETVVEIFSRLEGERIRVTDARLEGEGLDRLGISFEPKIPDSTGKSQAWTLTLTTKPPFGDEIVRGAVVVEIEGRDSVRIELVVNPR